jgi:hypothetical protein
MKSIFKAAIILTFITGCTTSPNPGKALTPPEVRSSIGEASVVKPVSPTRTITVGGAKADIQGFTSAAIQTAVNALHDSGNGGTVELLPGTYDIIAPVMLFDNITLKGSGAKTILKKCRGFRSKFAIDADYGELQVTVADASGFKPGMGVAVFDDQWRSGWDVTTSRITAIKGNTIYIDEFLVRDYHSEKNGTLSNACSVISAVNAGHIRIADLTVDGTRESNDMVDGCREGAIYLHKVYDATVENVIVKNFNCDGISWQITESVTVRNCEVYGCANAGLHPGTGSPVSLIEGNNSHDNDGYGLFVCWRVKNGIVRNNNFHNNGRNGISTGHKDTGMFFADNKISENGADGIYLRDEGVLNAPYGSIFRNNIIENNGVKEGGYGISVNGPAEGVVIEENTITSNNGGKQKAAIFLAAGTKPVEIKNNKISGHPDGEIIKGKL